jgi:hypothetical protein
MAFSNPIVYSFDGSNVSLDKINNDNYGSEYLKVQSSQEYRSKVRHSRRTASDGTRIDRHNIELVRTKYAAGSNPEADIKAYIVIEHNVGEDAAQVAIISDALTSFVTTTVAEDLVNWNN